MRHRLPPTDRHALAARLAGLGEPDTAANRLVAAWLLRHPPDP
ncbi:hypothetical protein [Aureimonas psammosilenae]|nr:hypothetical protein [Aureimonas psammosilenae]